PHTPKRRVTVACLENVVRDRSWLAALVHWLWHACPWNDGAQPAGQVGGGSAPGRGYPTGAGRGARILLANLERVRHLSERGGGTMQEQAGEGEEGEAAHGPGQALVVARQAAEAGQPAEAALDDPAAGQQH